MPSCASSCLLAASERRAEQAGCVPRPERALPRHRAWAGTAASREHALLLEAAGLQAGCLGPTGDVMGWFGRLGRLGDAGHQRGLPPAEACRSRSGRGPRRPRRPRRLMRGAARRPGREGAGESARLAAPRFLRLGVKPFERAQQQEAAQAHEGRSDGRVPTRATVGVL